MSGLTAATAFSHSLYSLFLSQLEALASGAAISCITVPLTLFPFTALEVRHTESMAVYSQGDDRGNAGGKVEY